MPPKQKKQKQPEVVVDHDNPEAASQLNDVKEKKVRKKASKPRKSAK